MKLYLDYNIVNYLRAGNDTVLLDKFESLRENSVVLFSPAHLEEIAVSKIRDGVDESIIKEEIDFLTKIACKNSLRPITRNEVVIYDEYPIDCYERVIQNYEGNTLAEAVEAYVITDANKNPAGSPKHMNNIKPEEVINNILYRELIALSLMNDGLISKSEMHSSLSWEFSDYKNRFCIFEHSVNFAANVLEKLGFFRENEKKSRSRLHDVSHIIYAAYSDVFVSADKKLINKTKAIYSLLDVPTRVLSVEEFKGM